MMKVEIDMGVLILFLFMYILMVLVLLEIVYFENHLRELITLMNNLGGN